MNEHGYCLVYKETPSLTHAMNMPLTMTLVQGRNIHVPTHTLFLEIEAE